MRQRPALLNLGREAFSRYGFMHGVVDCDYDSGILRTRTAALTISPLRGSYFFYTWRTLAGIDSELQVALY
jgi:hypothetical protein